MTDENETGISEEQVPDELETLKARAKLMGITHHPKIGADKLRAKIQAKLSAPIADKPVVAVEEKEAPLTTTTLPKGAKVLTEKQYSKSRRAEARRNASKLIRIRVTCMNPNKKEWEGEIISVGSARLGTFKKFVPFNNDEGFHVPYIIYQTMKDRKCTVFHTVKGPRGDKIRKGRLVNEFGIEVLPALTKEELKDLANQQAMAGGVS